VRVMVMRSMVFMRGVRGQVSHVTAAFSSRLTGRLTVIRLMPK
jgi:hypothetical protein